MSGFLDRLAARATGPSETLRPRVRSRFEPDGGALVAAPLEAPAPLAPPAETEETVAVRPALAVPAARHERSAAVPPEATLERRNAAPFEAETREAGERPERLRPRGPAPAMEPAAPPPRQPETFSVAWPVLDQFEEAEPPAPAPRVMPRVTPKAEPPTRREEPLSRLEPRAKGPFPLGGGGLEKGEGQDGGGPGEGTLNYRENRDGGRPRPAQSDPPDRTDRSDPADRQRRPSATRPAAREDEGEGFRLAARDLPTLAPRGELPAELPVMADDEPSETVVRINIGQIDVRMPPSPPAPRPAARAAGPRLTLADYLKARQERRR